MFQLKEMSLKNMEKPSIEYTVEAAKRNHILSYHSVNVIRPGHPRKTQENINLYNVIITTEN